MVRSAKDWRWSSYRGTAGMVEPNPCLTTDWVLLNFGQNKRIACEKYREFVRLGKNQPSPWESLKNQIYLGSDHFIERVLCQMDPEQSLTDNPKSQKQ